jgi:FkbM family methyltransferase
MVGATSIGERVRRFARGSLPRNAYAKGAAFLDGWYGIQKFSLDEYRRLSAIRRSPMGGPPAAIQLRPLAFPLYLRPGTPDVDVVIHAIARETYAFKLPTAPVKFIIDAGANIGDTAVWYATRFPSASIVAIEPDPENLAMLQQNCAPYSEKIRVLEAALWPVPDKQMETAGTFTGIHVAESRGTNESTCPSIDPLTILRDSCCDAIDIFKIDIEGAELELFAGDCDAWLAKTRSIAIEIHSDEANKVVLAAAKRHEFKHTAYRDLNFFWR